MGEGFYVIMHDFEREDLHFKSRFHNQKSKKQHGLPETFRLRGVKGTVQYDDACTEYLRFLNGYDERKLKYLLRPFSGLVNSGRPDSRGNPKVETLTFGGNPVYVKRIDGNKAYISTLVVGEPIPHVKWFPPAQRFWCITENGTLQEPPVGAVYTFLVVRKGETPWIDIKYLKKLD